MKTIQMDLQRFGKELFICLHIHPNTAQQLQVRSAGFEALSSSLELHPGRLSQSCATAGQTAVLQALTLGHMRSNDYSTTTIFVDNFLLSIMSTNRCSPSCHGQEHQYILNVTSAFPTLDDEDSNIQTSARLFHKSACFIDVQDMSASIRHSTKEYILMNRLQEKDIVGFVICR